MCDEPTIDLAYLARQQRQILSELGTMRDGAVVLNTKLDEGFKRTDASLAAMRTEMAAFRSGVVEELGKTRAAIMEKVEVLQNAVTDIHADIAVNFGAVDQARLVNNNTRDEMRSLSDTVARMMTLILRLQTEVAELKGKPAP